MNHGYRSSDAREHEEIAALLPWYVNGTVGEHERQRVDAHLTACPGCRDELAQERRIYQGMAAEPAVEYMPAASLKRLQARLDGVAGAAPANAEAPVPAARKPPRRPLAWQGLIAASVAVMAVALSLLAADRWMRSRAAAPDYYTVTSPTAHAPGEVVRAVFSPTITLVELQGILDEAQLRIISGPTEAGVYSLAANSPRPVSSSLALLRAHPKVRFAESIQPSVGPGDTP
jgi:anti-sigma factor RsiW